MTTHFAHLEDLRALVGQTIPGGVEVRDHEVVIEMDLPLLLSVMKGPLEAAVKKEGGRLLAP